MRLATWILVLSVLNFGIGWVSAVIARSDDEVADEARGEGRRRGGPPSFMRGGGSPFLGELREAEEVLELTDEQKDELALHIAETSEAVREHERAIFEVFGESRQWIADFLTVDQVARLEEFRRSRMDRFHAWKMNAVRDWFASQDGVTEERLADVMAIFEASQADKRACYGKFTRDGESEDVSRDQVDAISAQRDEDLEALVGAPMMEAYRDAFSGGHGRSRHRGGPRSDGSDGFRGERSGEGRSGEARTGRGGRRDGRRGEGEEGRPPRRDGEPVRPPNRGDRESGG